MTLVGDSMTAPPVVVDEATTLDELARVLETRRISAVPVMSDDRRADSREAVGRGTPPRRLTGVVSTSDVVRALASQGDEPIRARSLMSTGTLVARPDEPLEEAARRLVAGRVHRLIVVDEDRPVGVLAARDVLVGLQRRRVTAPLGALMTTPVQTIEVGDTIDAATKALASTNVHGLVVVDAAWPVGVFTHQEALSVRALPRGLRQEPVEELMSYETICLDVGTPAFRAVAHAVAMGVRRFLVVEDGCLVGVVSCFDLVRALARPAA